MPRVTIPVARPAFGNEEAVAVARVLASGWVTQGPEVAAFEREFAAYVRADYACAVSSCTAALHLALLAVGVDPGDEVLTVSHSFIATANSIRYCGAVPVFVDILADATYNVNALLLERAVTERTRAILCVHQMGMPCDMPRISAIAQRHNLPVIEDAACAIGSEIHWWGGWKSIGRPHGDIACFSFHPRKVVTTGDGGMITTSNAQLDEECRLKRQHGMSIPDTVRHHAPAILFESYGEFGFNYRMTDIQAAIGRVQLGRLPSLLVERRERAARYSELLRNIPGLEPPLEPEWARSNWQSYCVRLPDGLDQRTVMQVLLDAGIATRRGIMCAHREAAYADGQWSCGDPRCKRHPGGCDRLIESERAQDQSIVLPLFPGMTDTDQDAVVRTLAMACSR